MTDDESNGNQRDPKGDRASAPVAQENEEHAASDQPHGKSNPDGRAEPVRKRWTGYEWTTVVIQVVTGLALIAYTVFSYNMWQAMKESNAASGRSADNAEKALAKSNEQFDLLRLDAANAAKEDRTRFERQLTASKDQSEASRKQSAAGAAASLTLARESMQRAEMPVLMFDKVELLTDPNDGSLVVRATVRNVGRTAARDPHPACSAVAWKKKPFEPYGAEAFTMLTSIGPGQTFQFSCNFTPINFRSPKPELSITATIVYEDSFSERLVEFVCYRSDAQGNMDNCPNEDPKVRRTKTLFPGSGISDPPKPPGP